MLALRTYTNPNPAYTLPLSQPQIEALHHLSAAYDDTGASPALQASMHSLLLCLYVYRHETWDKRLDPLECFNALRSWGNSGEFKPPNLITQVLIMLSLFDIYQYLCDLRHLRHMLSSFAQQ